jgi:HK97 family phage prohead protease
MTILVRTSTAELEVRDDGDGRTLEGTIVPFGVETRIGPRLVEVFHPGAFAGTDPATLPLLALHDRQTLPIGVGVELRDEPTRWFGAFHVSKTRLGDEVLELVRDGALTGLSVGFLPVVGGDRWNADRTRVERIHALAHHVGVVPFPVRLRRRAHRRRTGGPGAGNATSAHRSAAAPMSRPRF